MKKVVQRIACILLVSILVVYGNAEYIKVTDLVTARVAQEVQNPARWYCIIGGPGAGKTSLINFLAQQGYAVVPEAATILIQQALEKGIHEPWFEPHFSTASCWFL